MTNNSPLTKTVFGVTGYYTDADDAGKNQVKISTDSVQKVVKSGKTAHLKFKFTPQMEASKRGLLILIDYYDSDEPAYKSIGHLNTIELVYADSLYDLQSISIYILLLALIAGSGYYVFAPSQGKREEKKPKRTPKKPVDESKSEEEEADMDWIPAHVKTVSGASSRSSKKKGKN
ncbi:hypothetical protein HDV03_000174 [Kappamyces sp. JEL0829]|nr:hypothetical protein HDV03_000174 [Kappamyces sp. JEL0829]